jgi:hypothetical protein
MLTFYVVPITAGFWLSIAVPCGICMKTRNQTTDIRTGTRARVLLSEGRQIPSSKPDNQCLCCTVATIVSCMAR